MTAVSLSQLLTQAEQIAALSARLDHLERAVLLLAGHVGATGWNWELQKALDAIREDLR